MNVVLNIDGRKAIPVRALHFVAGRDKEGMSCVSPDEIAQAAAHQDCATHGVPLNTYQVVDGVPRLVAPAQWPQFVIALEALSARLSAEQHSHLEGYARWKDEAISLLPAGVFVWLDEFQEWFSRTRPLLLDVNDSSDGGGHLDLRYESDELHLHPLIPAQLRHSIREGFEWLIEAPEAVSSVAGRRIAWRVPSPDAPEVQVLDGVILSEAMYPEEHGMAGSDSLRTRHDDIQIEIDDIVAGLKRRKGLVNPAAVMRALRDRGGRADSCVSESAPDGVIWKRGSTGVPEKLTMAALKGRLDRRKSNAKTR